MFLVVALIYTIAPFSINWKFLRSLKIVNKITLTNDYSA